MTLSTSGVSRDWVPNSSIEILAKFETGLETARRHDQKIGQKAIRTLRLCTISYMYRSSLT